LSRQKPAEFYAGAEVIRLIQNPKIQIAAPTPNAVNSALHMKEQK